jgi:hypothetical protein
MDEFTNVAIYGYQYNYQQRNYFIKVTNKVIGNVLAAVLAM